MASAEKPMLMSSDTWLCLRSWMRTRLTPLASHPRFISWLRKCFVTAKICSCGSRSSLISKNSFISSFRNLGIDIFLTDLGVLGSVMVSTPFEALIRLGDAELCCVQVEICRCERKELSLANASPIKELEGME